MDHPSISLMLHRGAPDGNRSALGLYSHQEMRPACSLAAILLQSSFLHCFRGRSRLQEAAPAAARPFPCHLSLDAIAQCCRVQ